MLDRLDALQESRDGQAALEGDPSAIDRITKRVEQLRDTVKVGLVNGDLNTNTPLGQTPAATTQRVRYFFDNIPTYFQAHAQQIEALKGFHGVDHGWGAIVHTESRIVTMLNKIDVDSTPMIRGGDVPLQRSGLSLAIANAHHDGRVVLSEPGIRRVELVLGEESGYRIRVPPSQQGAVSLQLLMGEASARTLVRSGGLLATGADAILTAHRTAELLEQGNTAAAQSEFNHAVARNVGGWGGGAAMSLALGGSGFVPAAVVAADALLLSKAFEKGADLMDNRAVYHQTDTSGVKWEFSGQRWERQASFDLTADGLRNPTRERVTASYEKSQELGAMASAVAVGLALGKVPPPQDPFTIPAQASDQRGLDNQDWHRNADTSAWERQVKTGVSGANDRGTYETQTATPVRAQQLNQEALGRIETNIATGREAIAAAYLENHAAQRAQHHGVGVPAAVLSAQGRPDAVLGSDKQLYRRDEAGQWSGRDGLASGNLAMELELTSQMRQPSLERSQHELAAIEALPAPSAAQVEKNELLHRYRSAGIDLNVNPYTQQAIGLAVQRTREANGITGHTMQQLKPDGMDTRGYDSPIVHYQAGPDRIVRQVAVTSSEELQQALKEVQARRPDSPAPDLPQRRVHVPQIDESQAAQPAIEVRSHGEHLAPYAARPVPTVDGSAQPAAHRAPEPITPMQAGHPDHALYQQIREHVTALDAKHGRSFDGTSERMTASLLVLAKGNGLDRVDHVLLSNATPEKSAAHHVFVVQGEPSNPAHQRAHMPTEQAAQTPVEASLQQFEVVSQEQQQRIQAQQLEQQLQNEREQQGQARGMSMG
ncbi:MAG: XVIPCD domain-containing protein [Pseudomonas sp.]|uniref:XVIPCD domain-containing protein n=2 Tax=Gammaproteobacteria TaxID=1236 RepID=UPI003D701331